MGGYGPNLKEFSDPIAWNFLSERTQNPSEVGKYLKEKCNDNSNEKNLIARSWFLVYAYRTLLDTTEQQIKAEGQENKSAEVDTQFMMIGNGAAAKPHP